MAFRRKSNFATATRRRTKVLTQAQARRSYKHVTRQWWMSFNIKCQIVEAVPGPDCPNGSKILIFDSQLLQGAAAAALGANFADAVRIRRMQGNLYFKPQNSLLGPSGNGTGCLPMVTDQANHNVYMRMGLSKQRGNQTLAGVPLAMNPLNNGATPFEVGDYADGTWMKLWEHLFPAVGTIASTLQNNFSCCSTQAGYTVPPEATGDRVAYDVPPIVCQPCGDVETPAVNQGCVFEAEVHRWWHVPIRWGRTIVLKEADDLSLYFGWERLEDTTDIARLAQPSMKFFGGLRLLLES